MAKRSSDGVYARPSTYENHGYADDVLHPDMQAIVDEFAGSHLVTEMAARVGVEMAEYGIDAKTIEGQQLAARVLRNRLASRERSTPASLERAAAIRRSAGTGFVYYLDLYGSAVKIGYSANVLQRLRSLRRQPEHILALEPGGYALESQRHRQFKLERKNGTEDFARSARLLHHIDIVIRQNGDPMSVLAEAGQAKPA